MSSVPAFDVGDVVQRRVDGVNVPATVIACTRGSRYTLRYEDDAAATVIGVAESELCLALVLDEPD